MRELNKTKLIILALIVLSTFTDHYVFAVAAEYCATRAVITVPLIGTIPSLNITHNEPPQSDSGSTQIIHNPNGTTTLNIYGETALSFQLSASSSLSHITLDLHDQFWTSLENMFDLMENISAELNLMLISIFCVFELKKNFPKPFLS
jgi:hypothetical protein